MAFFMTQFSYTPEAWAAMTRAPEDRTKAGKARVEAAGGRLTVGSPPGSGTQIHAELPAQAAEHAARPGPM